MVRERERERYIMILEVLRRNNRVVLEWGQEWESEPFYSNIYYEVNNYYVKNKCLFIMEFDHGDTLIPLDDIYLIQDLTKNKEVIEAGGVNIISE